MVVSIPYAPVLAELFPGDRVRSRRDFPKLLGLIEASAFLHQQKREKRDEKLVADSDDYLTAKQLFENCYATGPDSKLTELLESAESINSEFRVSDLLVKTGWCQSKTYAVLKRAEELGCIAESENRGVYRFIRNSAVPPLELPDAV